MSSNQISLYLIGFGLLCIATGIQSMNALYAWRRGRRFFLMNLFAAIVVFLSALVTFFKLHQVIS